MPRVTIGGPQPWDIYKNNPAYEFGEGFGIHGNELGGITEASMTGTAPKFPRGVAFIRLQGWDDPCGCPCCHKADHIVQAQQRTRPSAVDDIYTDEEWATLVHAVDSAYSKYHWPMFPCNCFTTTVGWMCVQMCCLSCRSKSLVRVFTGENERLLSHGLRWDGGIPESAAIFVLSWTEKRASFEAANPQRRKITQQPLPWEFLDFQAQWAWALQAEQANEHRLRSGLAQLSDAEIRAMKLAGAVRATQYLASVATSMNVAGSSSNAIPPAGPGTAWAALPSTGVAAAAGQQELGPSPPQQTMGGPPLTATHNANSGHSAQQQVEGSQQPAIKYCSKCGTQTSTASAFCSKCGANV